MCAQPIEERAAALFNADTELYAAVFNSGYDLGFRNGKDATVNSLRSTLESYEASIETLRRKASELGERLKGELERNAQLELEVCTAQAEAAELRAQLEAQF